MTDDGETEYINDQPAVRRLKRAKVTVVDGVDKGRSFGIEQARVTLGRSAVCEIHLSDRSVSNTHAEIEVGDDGWLLRDLGSTNGTFVGELRLREAVVPIGTRFKVGSTVLQLDQADGSIDIALSESDRFHDLVGRSVAMRQVFAQLEKLAALDLTVLITGETGTGKELVARALHRASKRSGGPLVVQDCSALPRDLVESVLFGHEKGAFTGANERRAGSFEQAQHGTVFLDEVGELDLGLQPKLLRVLESRELRRVGGAQTIAVDVRVVAATNRDLRAMAANGAFREDLYYRLGVVTVELPPLRARREDIPLLARALMEQFCKRNPELGPKSFTESAIARLQAMALPGNVRELRNLVERAASLSDKAEVTADDLLPVAAARLAVVRPSEAPARAALGGVIDSTLSALPFKEAKSKVLEAFEPAYLSALLERHHGNITHSATAAGLTRYHLRELCKRYGLRDVDNEPE